MTSSGEPAVNALRDDLGTGVRALLVDADPAADTMVWDGARPVWPVSSDADRRALERLAALHSVRLQEVCGTPIVVASSAAASGDVVALGSQLSPLAALYAHLTGRRSRATDADDDLGDSRTRPSVVVTRTDRVTPRLLDELSRRGRPAGIVAAGDDAAIRRRVLLRAASATLRATGLHASAELHASLALGLRSAPSGTVLGADATAADVRRVLAQGTELLAVATHSDGVDMMLPAGLTSCAVAADSDAPHGRPPCCAVTGWCFRHGVPVGALAGGDLAVDADAIRARILVLDTCFGVLAAGSPVDPRWGFVEGLLDSGTVGTIVAGYGIVSLDPRMLAVLLDRLYAGDRIADAVEAVNGSEQALHQGGRFCVLGDPDVRASHPRLPRTTSPIRVSHDAPAAPDEAGTAFLRLYLAAAKDGAADDLLAAAHAADRALAEYELAGACGTALEGEDAPLGRRLREAVLAFVDGRGTFAAYDWGRLEHDRTGLPAGRCATCHAPTAERRVTFKASCVATRRVTTCPRCGIVADAAAGERLDVEVDVRTVRLVGPLPRHPWSAMLRLTCRDDRFSASLPWPSADDGAPARELYVPPPWPPGPIRADVVLIERATVSILGGSAPGDGARGEWRDPRAGAREDGAPSPSG
jgi:hypothetical protein